MSEYTFKVGLVGPSRIGKTTLIAAIFEQGRKLLQGLPMTLEAESKTQRSLRDNHNAITASVDAGRFNPDSLRGTQSALKYELGFTHGEETFNLHVLDFPGRWLTDDEQRWKRECDPWLSESPVLLVPTDASLLMEPVTDKEHKGARGALGVYETGLVLDRWAKKMKENRIPALLAFVPLKTETYFNDNGGHRYDAETLRRRFDAVYGSLIDNVRAELGDHAANVRIEYHPVDTLGCVDLQRISWKEDGPVATFEVRRGQPYSPLGADDLLSSILRVPFQIVRFITERREKETKEELEKDRGFFNGLWYWASGQKGQHKGQVAGFKQKRSELNKALQQIAQRSRGNRVHVLEA